jgi:hypothetical protein
VNSYISSDASHGVIRARGDTGSNNDDRKSSRIVVARIWWAELVNEPKGNKFIVTHDDITINSMKVEDSKN